jgi:hypothetical protein
MLLNRSGGGQNPSAVQEIQHVIGSPKGGSRNARRKNRSFVRFGCPEYDEAGMARTRQIVCPQVVKHFVYCHGVLAFEAPAGTVPTFQCQSRVERGMGTAEFSSELASGLAIIKVFVVEPEEMADGLFRDCVQRALDLTSENHTGIKLEGADRSFRIVFHLMHVLGYRRQSCYLCELQEFDEFAALAVATADTDTERLEACRFDLLYLVRKPSCVLNNG